MNRERYEFLPGLFLRAPFFSDQEYDLKALPQVLKDQHFQNAIWLASPEFYYLIKVKDFDFLRLSAKEKFTLAKYYNRMCFRPTPFASFASITNLSWAGEAPIVLADNEAALLHLLPDRELSSLRFQARRPFSTDTLVVRNPTIYRVGQHIRYFYSVLGPKGRFRFTIDQIDAADFNLNLLKQLDGSAKRAGELEYWISNNADCTQAEAHDYLRFLIEDQLLYIREQGQVITRQAAYGREKPEFWASRRERPLKEVGDLAATSYELASSFSERDSYPRKAFYYATLERPYIAGGLNLAMKDQLQQAINVLKQLAMPMPLDALQQFIKDFQARFDLQKVPLLQALDPDTGVHYGDRIAHATGYELLEDIRFPAIRQKPGAIWESNKQFFLKLWLNDQRRDFYAPINIQDSDLAGLTGDHAKQHPPTIAVMFRVGEEQLIIDSAGGSSATQLIGRFSAISDQTWAVCRQIAETEQENNPDIVFADISAQSDRYLDNINQRRPIYAFELPLNVYSDLPAAQQLLPEDLLLSVRKGELILESKRLGKRVIPRLASAYNYHHNELPLFRLLGDLQFQGLKANWNLDLAQVFPGLAYYPRVVYQKTVLSPAKWLLTLAQIKTLQQALMSPAGEQLAVLRAQLTLPAFISVGQYDQQLVFDLDNKDDQLFLAQWLKDKKELMVKEYLRSDRSISCGRRPLAGQFVGFLKQDKPVYLPLYQDSHPAQNKARKFVPGDDWLYLKLYCTPASANVLLEKLIYPVIQKYRMRLIAWFFIRYSDPGHHLRLRLRVRGADIGQLLIAFKQQIKKQKIDDIIHDFRIDTYLREIERYGAKYIVQAENIFFAGSHAVAKYFFQGLHKKNPLAEFCLGFMTTHNFVQSFYQQKSQMVSFVTEVTDSFLNEFQADKNLKIDLDQKFRTIKPQMDEWLNKRADLLREWHMTGDYESLLVQVARIREMLPQRRSHLKKRMLADLIHMQLNRTFSFAQRQQELLVYYCLLKYLVSEMAKAKKLAQAG